MKKSTQLFILLGVVSAMSLAACTPPNQSPGSIATSGQQIPMPNPASVYCLQNGNKHEIVTNIDGSQSGDCVFPDGSKCEEWAYFKGECGSTIKENIHPTATITPTGDGAGCNTTSGNSGTGTAEMSGEGTPVINTTDTSKVTVTYIGNSGFMITTCHKKILIDAVFVGIKYVYTLPEDIQNSLALAQPPFENVDLILVSHGHRDHYNRNLVQQHLEHNPNTAFASQSIFSSQFSSLPNQIIDLDPSPGKPVQTDLDGIQVKAFSLTHSDGQPPNIGFLIVVDGVKLFFPGDYDITRISFEEFRAYELPEENIDIAFIPHFDLTDGATEQQFVKEGIGAKYIIPFHYYYTNPTMNRKAVLGNYPDAIFFDKELASWEMPE